MAESEGLDLVEIQPTTRPPVCALMDYSKYKYDQSKTHKKQKTIADKEIRLRPVSNEHDVDIKINQLKKFLTERRVVLISIGFKNREINFKDNGFVIVNRIIEAVKDIAKVEQTPRFEGRRLTARLAPK